MSFHPSRHVSERPALPHDSVFIETSDGVRLNVWRLHHHDPVAEVLFFHGNRGNLGTWCSLLEGIHSCRVNLTALDYRGYGDSEGTPSEEGLYRDVEACLTYHETAVQPDLPVVYWGRSLGGVMASYATHLNEPDGLVLEATFPHKDVLIRHYPVLRWLGRLSSYQFPTSAFLTQRRCPVLVTHGSSDTVVPYSVGEQLFDELSPPKEFFTVPQGGHGLLHLHDPETYWTRLGGFIGGIRKCPTAS